MLVDRFVEKEPDCVLKVAVWVKAKPMTGAQSDAHLDPPLLAAVSTQPTLSATPRAAVLG
jgi:hypothetical protein